ncbi:MAG: hypothetical protein ACYDER_07785 [Ktedonobacteraceae bacterium]
MEHPKQRSHVRKTQSTVRRQPPYSFEEETSIVARSVINVVQSSRIDPHPLVVALLEGYARRIRELPTDGVNAPKPKPTVCRCRCADPIQGGDMTRLCRR